MDDQVGNLITLVQANCNISDARHAGLFSLCGLLLRLRDLFKWEQEMNPWEEPEPSILMEWVDRREDLWESLLHEEFHLIPTGEGDQDPFDARFISAALKPSGLVYGAGYVLGMKPSFFLGRLGESHRMDGLHVDVVDRELARDIFATPIMRQGDRIVARRSVMLFALWDLILEMRPSAREALKFALAQYGLDVERVRRDSGSLGPELVRIADGEMDTWIHHEVGEYHENIFPGEVWHEIVSTYCGTPIEIYARVVKDLLADTHPQGLLGHIVRHRIKSSLGFYVANARAFMRLLFPEIHGAFGRFLRGADWEVIEEARQRGQENGRSRAEHLVALYLQGKEQESGWSRGRILSEIIEPLGIMSGFTAEEPDETL